MPVHFHFPNVVFVVRWFNQAQGVCKALNHQWELWLGNGCTTLTSQFTWHSSTSGCLCMGCSTVLPAPKGPHTGKIPCTKVRCATLDFDSCRGWCGSMFIGCHTGVDAAVLRHQVADLQGELSWVTVDAGSPSYKTLLHLLMAFIEFLSCLTANTFTQVLLTHLKEYPSSNSVPKYPSYVRV